MYNMAAQAGTSSYNPANYRNQYRAPSAYQPGQFGYRSFTQPGMSQSYMSPFIENAVAPQMREAQRQADIASTRRSAQMGQLGAFGGSREAIENAEADRNLATQKSDIMAQGLQSAYQAAQNQFNAEQNAGLTVQQQQELANQFGYGQNMTAAANRAQYGQAANQLQEQANQYGAGFGLQALNAGMQGMQNYGNLSGLYNNQQMNIANAQNQMGQQAQGYQQQQLTQNYNDFLNQQNFPFQQIGQMSNVLRGMPLNQQTQAVYQQAPSLASQAAGFGTAAIGAANLFGKAEGGIIGRPSGLPALAISQMG
jgi:hypothetical protein